MNNVTLPLKLTYNPQLFVGYKVNKPLDQSGEYVDKKVADNLLQALIELRKRCEQCDAEFNMPFVNEAIEQATTNI